MSGKDIYSSSLYCINRLQEINAMVALQQSGQLNAVDGYSWLSAAYLLQQQEH